MTIRPVFYPEVGYGPENGFWEVMDYSATGKTIPLPFGMIVKSQTKEGANNSVYMVAEQLGSLGFRVDIEEAE